MPVRLSVIGFKVQMVGRDIIPGRVRSPNATTLPLTLVKIKTAPAKSLRVMQIIEAEKS